MKNRHIRFWCAYLFFGWLVISTSLHRPENTTPFGETLLIALGAVLSLLPAYLSAVYLGIPGLIKKLSGAPISWTIVLFRFFAGLLAGILLYRLAIHLIVYPHLYQYDIKWNQFYSINRILSNITDLSIPMLLFGGIWLWDAQQKSRQKNRELEFEKLQIELQFLRAQTNPHFIFNSLNNLYGLARKNDPRTPEALLQLSQLLRYLLYECAVPRVPLHKEIGMLQHYMDLMQLRRFRAADIHTHSELGDKTWLIAPGLLLPLMENAFKFSGDSEDQEASIDWDMQISGDGKFKLRLKNSTSSNIRVSEGGIGLRNLKRQLEIEYPEAHALELDKGTDYFEVNLMLQLEAYENTELSDRRG